MSFKLRFSAYYNKYAPKYNITVNINIYVIVNILLVGLCKYIRALGPIRLARVAQSLSTHIGPRGEPKAINIVLP